MMDSYPSSDNDRRRLVDADENQLNFNYGTVENQTVEQRMGSSNESTASGRAKLIPQYLAAFAATSGAFAAGSAIGWSSPAENEVVNQTIYGFPVTNVQWSWVGSTTSLGAAFICLFIGQIMDVIGRKGTMLSLIVPFCIGWAMVIWPSNVYELYVGRFCLGIAAGAFFVVAPVYIGEIASNEVRGTLCSYFQLMITAGVLFVYTVGHFFTVFTYSAICAIIPLIFGFVFVTVPETPHFWIIKKNPDKAIKSLKWLRGDEYRYEGDLAEICAEQEAIMQRDTSILKALQTPAMKRAMIITFTLMFFVQMCGINVVIFYTGFIFDAAQISIDPSLATIIIGVMQVIATFIASLMIDRWGRRILLLTSASVMCLCNVSLGLYFILLDNHSKYAQLLHWLPIIALCIYIMAFSLGYGPVPWVLVGELFNAEVKGIASSLSCSIAWLMAFMVTKFFSNVRDAIGLGQTFVMFAIFSIAGILFIWVMIPETKGQSFAEIQNILSGEHVSRTSNRNESSTTTNSIVI